jgi:hypothetical protein
MDNTENDWFTVCCLESNELRFLNIFLCNKVAMLCSVDLLHCLLNCITETIQVTGVHMQPTRCLALIFSIHIFIFIATIVYF